jgi:hypothetical protein
VTAIRLYLNGAFLYDGDLDASALLAGDYCDAQRRVVAALADRGANGWRYDDVNLDPQALRFSVHGKYSTLIPVNFASKDGPELAAAVDRAVREACTVEHAATAVASLDVQVEGAELDFFDFGVGVLGVMLVLNPRAALPLSSLRQAAETLSTVLVPLLNHVVGSSVREFDAAVRASLPHEVLEASWLQDDGMLARHSQGGEGETRGLTSLGKTGRGHLLWLHRTYIFTSALAPLVEDHVEQLLPSLFERDEGRDLLFVPGLGSSAIVTRTAAAESGTGLSDIRSLLTLMDLQWAYIAAVMEIDRTLFRRLNGFRAAASTVPSAVLEAESRSVLELYDRVRLFRASVSSIIVDLGGGSRRLWDVMARVQSLPEILSTIDDKLSALRDACETQLNTASIKRQRRIALTVDLFAGFSVVASVAGVAAFFFATDVDASTATRIAVLTLAVLVVLTALLGTRLARDARVEASMTEDRS